MTTSKRRTDQEHFWAGEFGSEYIKRSNTAELLASNIHLFALALDHAEKISSGIEFGANIGMNLRALQALYPGIDLTAVEINPDAAAQLRAVVGGGRVYEGSILDYPVTHQVDLVLIKGVLIHIDPSQLDHVYEKLYQAAKRYILVCEYYNPIPVAVSYRGHDDRLFKRDFAGELLDRFPDLSLLKYGFAYHRDPAFLQDDSTWFLLEKQGNR